MPVTRRQLLAGAAATAGGVLLGTGASGARAAAGRAARRRLLPTALRPDTGAPPPGTGGFYTPNRPPLTAAPFQQLPVGAVTPQGWLAEQLATQVSGLIGQMTSISHFCDYNNCGWITPSIANGWEEAPYWLRGFVDLGFLTGDGNTQTTAANWLDAIIGTAQSDGFFGPDYLRTSLNGGADLWPYFPLLQALRSHQEFTGDSRVVPLLTNFFHFMATQPAAQFTTSWIDFRWATCYESIIWLYNRTGDSSLLTLLDTAHNTAANWMNNLPTLHNVNVAQGFTEPALYGLRAGGTDYTNASYQNYATLMSSYGQFPGGGFAGDENARPGHGDPRQGFETCGIVEFMQSHEQMTWITGDPVWADHCEELAFNSLPAALDPTMIALHYVTAPNLVQLDDIPKTLGQYDNSWAMLAYLQGVDQYHCCAHNHSQGWPYFTEHLWLATPDGGLCANMYAPNSVTALVGSGSGTTVTINEQTAYPFDDTITLTVSTPNAVAFPLYVRVPGWCSQPSLRVNGQSVSAPAGPAYTSVNRVWSNGDTLTISLPQSIEVTTWPSNQNAVSISYGPIEYSLRIQENWTNIGGDGNWPQWQVTADSPWNYGLVIDDSNPSGSFTLTKGGPASTTSPLFTQTNVPYTITATAQTIPEWQLDSQNVITPLQASPASSALPQQQVTLIPMGAARLRLSSFPVIGAGGTSWIGSGPWFRIQNQNSGLVIGVSGMSMSDNGQVVQFDDNGTADHLWEFVANGDGWFRVQNRNSGLVMGVAGGSTADSVNIVQYDDNDAADHLWQFVDNVDGWFRLRNQNSGKVLGVANMSTADSANVVQFDDNGTSDHLWQFIPDANGCFRIENQNSSKVLGVAGMSTGDNADVVQFDDNGTADHLWRWRGYDTYPWMRLQNLNSGLVIAVLGMSTDDSVDLVQYDDNGTADHLWRVLGS
jgi:hypothetical protein